VFPPKLTLRRVFYALASGFVLVLILNLIGLLIPRDIHQVNLIFEAQQTLSYGYLNLIHQRRH